ncbi:hypothetical protein [Acidicapsa acidisoli]|uniref:hypothetical protein n=1 Tax=Acidicapsa acidisoli TaxID=1615681 RepID=UPI0021DFC5A0|nr:hypothetical protein [Acidicapsa acidisoli]
MTKLLTEFEKHSRHTANDAIDEFVAQETPIDELVEDLRSEFRRGMRREIARGKAEKQRRTKRWIIALAALAGVLGTAAAIEFVSHHSH